MLRDVFYYGNKPNVHPREKYAINFEDARKQATTEHFWIINEYCDYRGFNWDFDYELLPDDDVWAEEHINIWPSIHQKDSGTWLVPNNGSNIKVYRNDVEKLIRKNTNHWVMIDKIDTTKFDFSWHPDPTDPPYIYKWGCKWYPVEIQSVLEYHTPGAIEIKYMPHIVEVLPNYDNWIEIQTVDKSRFDMTYRPDPLDPPYIYVWGNHYIDATLKPTIEYHTPGATERKYVHNNVDVLPETERWIIPENCDIDSFDFSWRPDPREPDYIYEFGTQWQKTGGPKYVCPNATQIKYVDGQCVLKPIQSDNWQILNNYKIKSFDYSWHPDDTDDPYIYVFGNNQYPANEMPTIQYVVEGATEVKYVYDNKAILDTDMSNWIIPDNLDTSEFDFSWKPHPKDPAFIYEFGTQWQKTGGPRYVVEGATEIKYVTSQKAMMLSNKDDKNWYIPEYVIVDSFDFSWHPNNIDKPYIYQFGTQWALTGGPKYVVPGATEIKYIEEPIAVAGVNYENWATPDEIDMDSFDFSWHPYVEDQPYIYEFGTQHQKTGGPRYITPGCDENSPIKYIDRRILSSIRLPDKTNFETVEGIKIKEFDYSWHPDNTEQPYIYVFGNNLYPAEIMPTIKYIVEGATEIKYVSDIVATLDINYDNWIIPDNCDVSEFDFSWIPNPKDPPYIYQFPTQWHEYGGPQYVVPGATDYKFMDIKGAKTYTNKLNFDIPKNIDDSEFDYSWVPHPKDPPLIYEWGTQWQKTGGPRYVVKDATEVKYMTNQRVKMLSNENDKNWVIPDNVTLDSFDFSWHPDSTDKPFIYQFGTQWALTGGPKYVMPKAREVKYIEEPLATAAPCKDNWVIPSDIDVDSFDFSWHPYVEDQPYIYIFGTQWQKTGGPKYITPGATNDSPVKYIDTRILHATKLPNDKNFECVKGIKIKGFDYSWHPDESEPPYIYVFGNNLYPPEIMPTIKYTVEGATEIKYIHNPMAILDKSTENWIIPENIDVSEFDFSWIPNPHEPPYIYEFNTQWQEQGGPQYVVQGATEKKYVSGSLAKSLPNKTNFKVLIDADFDFSWHPSPLDPPYIYVFGNQWHDSVKDPTIEYVTPGATVRKYLTTPVAKVKANMSNWVIPDNVNTTNFDFSWRPDPDSPSYIYQFGTLKDDTDGPRYVTPDNNGEIVKLLRVEKEVTDQIDITVFQYYIETTLEDLINKHPNELFWAKRKNIDYSNFNFDWRPSIEQARYVHVFGSSDSEVTQTYFVNSKTYIEGHRELNYIDSDVKITNEYLAELFKPSDMFLVDRGNKECQERFDLLKQRFPNIQKTRFLNTWADTINRCINRSNTDLCWILNSELDYTNFDFKYYPNPWQMNMIHVFGTQWSHWGTTYMVNRNTFAEDTKYVKVIEHLKNLNFVKEKRAIATSCIYDIVVIDHGNDECQSVVDSLSNRTKNISTYKYDTSYFNTIKKLVDSLPTKKEHYIWICSSTNDYSKFDFSYICDPFAKDNLHVFASDKQKFGDTFLLDVNKTREIINDIDALQSYHKVNYIQHLNSPRLPAPVFKTFDEDHVETLKNKFNFPYAIFETESFDHKDVEPISLWTEETKNILVTSTGASRIIVPKELYDYPYINELYDFPYIKTNKQLLQSSPLDIVFLSNGEVNADENYEHLLYVTRGLKNRIVRVDGINGRINAYHATALASNTSWAFTVFAKIKVDNKFDWGWQPDRLQRPKHYIFTALNPLNGLEYGHQAVITYNKKLVLNNFGEGLDFTLDDPHESVDMLSGTANFNTDPYSTWRTAFREVIKLKSDYTDISQERLQTWLTVANGEYAKECLQGATDAVDYYNSVNGDLDQLKLSYEWNWLKSFYEKKYK